MLGGAQRATAIKVFYTVKFCIVLYRQCWVVCSKGEGNKSPNTGISAQLILGEVTQMGI